MKENKNILIIDDEQVVIDSISKILEMEHYSFDSVTDARSALAQIKVSNYDIIICDIMLPGMDGFQFLTELESRNVDTPVIMTTGFSTIDNAVKALYTGAIEFIPKPFTVDELVSVVHRGIKYNTFNRLRKINDESILLVPCPAKYFRLGYSSWMNKDFDGSVLIGATDCYIKTIDQIKNIELLPLNEAISQASPVVKFETVNGLVHQLYSVISGSIIARNEKLTEEPELLEKDPYFEGWIYRIIPSELEYEMTLLIPCSSDRT